MQSEIRQLLDRHCVRLAREMEELEPSLRRLSDIGPDSAASVLGAAIAQAHTIKGSSGSIGFAEISAAARDLEASLLDARAQGALTAPTRQGILDRLGVLSELVAKVRPEDSRFFSFDFSAFEREGEEES